MRIRTTLMVILLSAVVACNNGESPTSPQTVTQTTAPQANIASTVASKTTIPEPPQLNPATSGTPFTVSVKTDDQQYQPICDGTFSWNMFSKVLNAPIGGVTPDFQYKMQFRSTGLVGKKPSVVICPIPKSPGQCWDQESTIVANDGTFEVLFYKRESNMGWHRFKLTFGPGLTCDFTVQ